MLTGSLALTDGYARIAGKDIRTQMPQIRMDMGICPQHNCLFDELTVREHLQFFSRIKGLYSQVSLDEAEQHIDQSLRDIALLEKRNALSINLSGGMKRKLSVAIAFCGGSSIVLLDEPTSGMVGCFLSIEICLCSGVTHKWYLPCRIHFRGV
jgi:ABC-type multidrug transport system ATPase subunit